MNEKEWENFETFFVLFCSIRQNLYSVVDHVERISNYFDIIIIIIDIYKRDSVIINVCVCGCISIGWFGLVWFDLKETEIQDTHTNTLLWYNLFFPQKKKSTTKHPLCIRRWREKNGIKQNLSKLIFSCRLSLLLSLSVSWYYRIFSKDHKQNVKVFFQKKKSKLKCRNNNTMDKCFISIGSHVFFSPKKHQIYI